MRKESLDFFRALVNEPSPSGFEEGAAELYRQYTKPHADKVTTDSHGSVCAILNPDASTKILLAGHIDEIGFIIHYISKEGLLYFSPVGGHDSAIVVGQRVWVHGKERVGGVIGRKAIHLLEGKEREDKPKLDEMWIDIGAADQEEAEKYVRIGDCATYQWEYQELIGDRACARGFDNKMGAFVVAEALRLLKDEGGLHPDVGVYAAATVQEEIGLRGARTTAFSVDAQCGLAVDVNHATDYPTVSKTKYGDLTVGRGPSVTRGANISPVVFGMIEAAAAKESIPYQLSAAPGGTGTDANAMQISRGGMAVGLLGVPLRYMHTPCELLSLTDVELCARLMAAWCRLVTPETSFIPRPR